MAAVAGTIQATLTFQVSSNLANIYSICTNSTEATGYATDNSGNLGASIYSFPIGTFASFSTFLATGIITAPTGITISQDDATLYVLSNGGKIYGLPVATGIATQIGDLSTYSASSWRHCILNKEGTALWVTNTALKNIYKFDLATSAVTLYPFPFFVTGIAISSDPNIIFISGYSPGETRIFKLYVGANMQRWELIAGTGVTANTDGNVYTTAAFNRAYCLDLDSSNGVIYTNGNSTTLRKVQSGTVSSYAGISVNFTNGLYSLRASDRVLVMKNAYQMLKVA